VPLADAPRGAKTRPERRTPVHPAEASVTQRKADRRWVQTLRSTLDALPPKSSVDEQIIVLDPRGNPTASLASESDGPIAVRLLLLTSSKARATDIHVEPKGDAYAVRMRVDGQMVTIVDLPNEVGELIAGLIKTACQMKQAGREAVLDGSFSTKFNARRVDFRASFTPTVHGQKLVLRVLDARTAPQRLSDMHMPTHMQDRIRKLTEQDTGLLLTCGPTGSGKTTTLYNALREIDRETRNVVTIEDPVEYHLDNVTQIPITANTSFPQILRSVLRQDPDVILVGEIRDEETARVAMQAAMTGHVVFSTVHAKDSIGAVFRLLDLGVEQYLVANSLDLILAQRLVRVLCESCKRPVQVSPGQSSQIGRFLEGKTEVFAATGCAKCLRTGYHGRQGLLEMLEFSNDLRDIVLNNPTIQAMRRKIEEGVFTTLQQSGWLLAARGVTSLDEVERVAGSTG
jgi:general secretion pathway protein E